MRKWRGAFVAVASTAALLAGVVPAHATNEVNVFDCQADFGSQYFHLGIRNPNGTGTTRCFANAGDLDIGQGGVEQFSSGNNAGWFDYEPGDGYVYRHSFGKGESTYQAYGYVTHLHIN